MNYLVNFEKSEYFRAGGVEGEIEGYMFYETPLEDKEKMPITIESVDDVIKLMSMYFPEIKNYEIRETLLSLNDIEENDKIRAEQNCQP